MFTKSGQNAQVGIFKVDHIYMYQIKIKTK